jgi:hypothetical protein
MEPKRHYEADMREEDDVRDELGDRRSPGIAIFLIAPALGFVCWVLITLGVVLAWRSYHP